jgi:hypothetical protein
MEFSPPGRGSCGVSRVVIRGGAADLFFASPRFWFASVRSGAFFEPSFRFFNSFNHNTSWQKNS